jgi:hypothetical protein
LITARGRRGAHWSCNISGPSTAGAPRNELAPRDGDAPGRADAGVGGHPGLEAPVDLRVVALQFGERGVGDDGSPVGGPGRVQRAVGAGRHDDVLTLAREADDDRAFRLLLLLLLPHACCSGGDLPRPCALDNAAGEEQSADGRAAAR